MNKKKKNTPRNHAAMAMIIFKTGVKKIFTNRNEKRAKDARNSWQRQEEKNNE
jgi:hypothetical protein